MISLAGGSKHGHAMMLDIAEFSGQRLGPGTLYGALERLEQDGLIAALATTDRRTPYRLTGSGTAYLEQRMGEMDQLARVALARVALTRVAR